MQRIDLPVAVIGAGPVGLAAAAHLLASGQHPLLFEAGPDVGHSVRAWGHVRVFSPWSNIVDAVAASLLAEIGWSSPDPASYPTGDQIVDRYLQPLAAHPRLHPRLRLDSRVLAVSRQGVDKRTTEGRAGRPFILYVQRSDGSVEEIAARAVVDASGTYGTPNPLGASGVEAVGERENADRFAYQIPDVLRRDRGRYAGRRVLVVGSGHSALNVVQDLSDLAREVPGTQVIWAIRRPDLHDKHDRTPDVLPARERLEVRARELVESGNVTLLSGISAERVDRTDTGLVMSGGGHSTPPVDEIVVATGFRPDLSLLRELRVSLDPALESPYRLAPLIDPNVHTCDSVPPHGVDELSHPDEPDVFVVGMKSYGRAPTFLMLTGYEQVRSVVAALSGDWQRAREVRVVLPGRAAEEESSCPISILSSGAQETSTLPETVCPAA